MSGIEVECITEIPKDQLDFVSRIPIRCLLKPIILDELDSGKSERAIARQLGVSRSFVNYVSYKRKRSPAND